MTATPNDEPIEGACQECGKPLEFTQHRLWPNLDDESPAQAGWKLRPDGVRWWWYICGECPHFATGTGEPPSTAKEPQ